MNEKEREINLKIIVTVIVLVIVVATLGVYLAWARPWAHAEMSCYLDTNYMYTFSGTERVVVLSGKVFNHGDQDGVASFVAYMNDSRGYTLADAVIVGRVESGGGFVEVNKAYDWPTDYNGYDWRPDYVLPITLTVDLYWYDS